MAVTVGFFDGVHIGHRQVLRTLTSMGGRSTVITFWPHPRQVLGQDGSSLTLLSTLEQKKELIRQEGVQDVVTIPFTRDFASLTAEQFVDKYLIGRYRCDTLVLGYDNRLGSDGLDTKALALLCRSKGMKVIVVPPVLVDGKAVSSSRIRKALQEGDADLARQMLGREPDGEHRRKIDVKKMIIYSEIMVPKYDK